MTYRPIMGGAQGITVPIPKVLWGIISPIFQVDLADKTATTAAQDAVVACRFFMAYISIKTYVVGSATVGPIFKLLVSSVTGMTTPVVVDQITGDNTASATETQAYMLMGMVPSSAGLEFFQVSVTLSGSATIAFDTEMAASL